MLTMTAITSNIRMTLLQDVHLHRDTRPAVTLPNSDDSDNDTVPRTMLKRKLRFRTPDVEDDCHRPAKDQSEVRSYSTSTDRPAVRRWQNSQSDSVYKPSQHYDSSPQRERLTSRDVVCRLLLDNEDDAVVVETHLAVILVLLLQG